MVKITPEQIFLATGLLLSLSIFVSKLASKLNIPALLIFLSIGMLAGSEGIGGISFDDPALAQFLGVLALSFILFSGGLDTKWDSVKPILWQGLSLSTIGVLLTTFLVMGFVYAVGHLSLKQGFLLGAIVSSTDAAAVFSILRTKKFLLKRNIRSLIEFESASNDPMAVFLTLTALAFILEPELSVFEASAMFVSQMSVGALFGFLMGKILALCIDKIKFEYDGLYVVMTIALILLSYGLAGLMGGNGFLAVYISGLVVGNRESLHRAFLLRFHDGMAWIMQVGMFLVLGLLVFPSQLMPVAWLGTSVSLYLIFIARPLAIFFCLSFFRVPYREQILIAWAGLRGAVPIILATFPFLAHLPEANTIFNVVFFIVLISALIQGSSVGLIARLLGLRSS